MVCLLYMYYCARSIVERADLNFLFFKQTIWIFISFQWEIYKFGEYKQSLKAECK